MVTKRPLNPTTSKAEPLDPVERYLPLLLRLLLYGFLSFVFYQAATTFIAYHPGQIWPAFLNVFRTFTFLPLHEGGHFLFRFFGRTLYILGGSFWQVMFPLLWFLIALRQRSQTAPFALFWVGENLMDVSLYVRDAHFMALHLLGGDSSGHDWRNLLSQWNALDMAEDLADWLYYLGFLIGIGAIAAGIAWAFFAFFKGNTRILSHEAPTEETIALEDNLDSLLVRKKRDEMTEFGGKSDTP